MKTINPKKVEMNISNPPPPPNILVYPTFKVLLTTPIILPGVIANCPAVVIVPEAAVGLIELLIV